jgi:hypothetical protein
MVWLGDVAVIGIASWLIWLYPTQPLIWIIVALSFQAWYKTGGFDGWNPHKIKQFISNAKKVGL